MWPKPIYEILPYVYLLAGIASVAKLEVMSGRVGGFLLALAGYIIWRMRRDYRRGLA